MERTHCSHILESLNRLRTLRSSNSAKLLNMFSGRTSDLTLTATEAHQMGRPSQADRFCC